jgi:hypothetical protein
MKRLACLVILASCGSPADVAGTYTISVTDEDNGCNLMGFTQGQSTSNISTTISQDNDKVTIMVTGLAGAYLNTVLGSSTFNGSVDGDHLGATLFGTRSATMNGCAFTFNAALDGSLAGDTLTGTISYTPKTNGSPDCASIEGCHSTQNFNGTRPPK